MISRPPRRTDPQARCLDRKVRREMLVNWLALLTLLALGVVWPGDELPGAAVPDARNVVRRAPSAAQTRRLAQGTPDLKVQAPARYELP